MGENPQKEKLSAIQTQISAIKLIKFDKFEYTVLPELTATERLSHFLIKHCSILVRTKSCSSPKFYFLFYHTCTFSSAIFYNCQPDVLVIYWVRILEFGGNEKKIVVLELFIIFGIVWYVSNPYTMAVYQVQTFGSFVRM